MITGKIYSNGYWDGLEAIFLKDDPSHPGWVYVLAMELPDSSISINHAIGSRTLCFHAKIEADTPTIPELENISYMVYVKKT